MCPCRVVEEPGPNARTNANGVQYPADATPNTQEGILPRNAFLKLDAVFLGNKPVSYWPQILSTRFTAHARACLNSLMCLQHYNLKPSDINGVGFERIDPEYDDGHLVGRIDAKNKLYRLLI